jgi:hypothetical protein
VSLIFVEPKVAFDLKEGRSFNSILPLNDYNHRSFRFLLPSTKRNKFGRGRFKKESAIDKVVEIICFLGTENRIKKRAQVEIRFLVKTDFQVKQIGLERSEQLIRTNLVFN